MTLIMILIGILCVSTFILALSGCIALAYRLYTGKLLSDRYAYFGWLSNNNFAFISYFGFIVLINYKGTIGLLAFIPDDWGRSVEDKYVPYKDTIGIALAVLFSVMNISAHHYANKYFVVKNKERE